MIWCSSRAFQESTDGVKVLSFVGLMFNPTFFSEQPDPKSSKIKILLQIHQKLTLGTGLARKEPAHQIRSTGAIDLDEVSAQTDAHESIVGLQTCVAFPFKFLMKTGLKSIGMVVSVHGNLIF